MALISKKKIIYPINERLRQYLLSYSRAIELPLEYEDLSRYDNSIPLYDYNENDTFWETVFYPQSDMEGIHQSLKKIYALMKADGDMGVMEHLYVDRVDLCVYGNTQPFRVRIVNRINDNFDYFYIKKADASRVYGLELEHLLSPNKISYFVFQNTLIEEHIVGIPGDQFIKTRMHDEHLNEIRLAKEFVKFDERCFVRLLGDMHSSNFVIDITPDFEEVNYRLRAIDFDQQSFEGRKAIYMPRYFKQNNPIIELGLKYMTPETVKQYQREERSLIAGRIKVAQEQMNLLIDTMKNDRISTDHHVKRLKSELAEFYDEADFKSCQNMGQILELSLEMVVKKPNLYKES
ncbi:MAG: hypothetical protein KI790_13060 [Cyclobacteriaceae bacterium]|nr:hypothetical protein [Cyclobacteriaceae bacterium HetDA_MAG_MS6]